MDNLLWDRADAYFPDHVLCQINYRYKAHSQTCDLGKFGITYGIFVCPEEDNIIHFIECPCGKKICYDKNYEWEEED